jgi:hypothetical protein
VICLSVWLQELSSLSQSVFWIQWHTAPSPPSEAVSTSCYLINNCRKQTKVRNRFYFYFYFENCYRFFVMAWFTHDYYFKLFFLFVFLYFFFCLFDCLFAYVYLSVTPDGTSCTTSRNHTSASRLATSSNRITFVNSISCINNNVNQSI